MSLLIKEKILDERDYLLDIQTKHLNATSKILEQLKSEANNTDNSDQIINNEKNSSSNFNNEIYNIKDI